jgi:hypothetical protein
MSATSRVSSVLLAQCKNSTTTTSIGCSRLNKTTTTMITRHGQKETTKYNNYQHNNKLQHQQQVRYMGGDGGAHMPVPQSMIAEFPAKPTGADWETIANVVWPVAFLLAIYSANVIPDDCEAWAQQEARARLKLKEQGFTNFQFGVHYQDLNSEEIRALLDTKNTSSDNDEE